MRRFINRLMLLVVKDRRASSAEKERQDKIMGEAIARTRPSASPDTSGQWLVLQRSLAESRYPRPHPAIRPILRLSIGVALIALCFVGLYWNLMHRQPEVESYVTGRGQQTHIALPDSSEVILNHTSELTVEHRSPNGGRGVGLRGEALFRVRRNGTPFIVTTDIATIHVVGTEFNVRARGEALEVGVVTGTVRLNIVKNGIDSSVTLTRGQMALCAKHDFPAPPSAFSLRDYPGWLHGKFLFHKTPLLSACKEIGDRFNVDIRLSDPRLSNETITGILDGRNAESTLAALCGLAVKNLKYENQVYILY